MLLTGKPLRMAFGCAEQRYSAQRKKDGFWVFLNLPAALYTIIVEAPFYQSKEIMVPVEQNFSLIEVGLFPGRQFPFAQTVEWLTGTVPSKKPVWAVLEQKPPRFQLTESFASGGKELALYDTGSAFSILRVWIDGGKNKRGLFWLSPREKAMAFISWTVPVHGPWTIVQEFLRRYSWMKGWKTTTSRCPLPAAPSILWTGMGSCWYPENEQEMNDNGSGCLRRRDAAVQFWNGAFLPDGAPAE